MTETKGDIATKLAAIVGKEQVKTDPDSLAGYSRDQSFAPGSRPHYAVFPKTTAEVQDVIRLALTVVGHLQQVTRAEAEQNQQHAQRHDFEI